MNYVVTGEQLTDIANAIRSKTGLSVPLMFPDFFVDEIMYIDSVKEKSKSSSWSVSTTIPANGIYSMGFITTSNDMRAVMFVACTGLPSSVTLLIDIHRETEPQSIDLYIYNPTASAVTISKTLTVDVSYYE